MSMSVTRHDRARGHRRLGARRRPGARRAGVALAGLAAAALALGAVVATRSWSGGSSPRGTSAADAFLARYVDPNGRVVRRDQGADTVSEGQAYAMILAQAAGRPDQMQRIWDWTRTHLQQRDGLLAYHADASGRISDSTPATDADLLAAWALSRATGPQAGADRAQARRLAAAILDRETISRAGHGYLTAGPWATGSPGTLDPSYWALGPIDDLARFTGDPRWHAVAATSRAVTDELTRGGTRLPPDWARLNSTTATPEPAPGGQAPQVRYGLDAQRLVVWLAASCTPGDRALAARLWPLLRAPRTAGAIALSTAGQPIDSATNATPYVAAAAAAGAAGEDATRARLLAQAGRIQTQHPTYYGGAWLALGQTLLGGECIG